MRTPPSRLSCTTPVPVVARCTTIFRARRPCSTRSSRSSRRASGGRRKLLPAALGTRSTALRAGSLAWVRLASDPVIQRVLLLDAPSVLGWQRRRDMDERHTLGLIRAVLQACAARGQLPPELTDMFAHILFASLNELALLIARAAEPATATRSAELAIDELIGRLLRS